MKRNRLVMAIALTASVFATANTAEELDLREFHFPSQSLVEDMASPTKGITDPNDVRRLVPLALDMIKHFEGWFSAAYDDPADYCTIGFGHLLAYAKCETLDLSAIQGGRFAGNLTDEEGGALLEEDLLSSKLVVQEAVAVDLSHEQFGALTSFVFNVGKTNFTKSTLLRLLNRGEYELAAEQFARWVNAGGRLLPGLVARRSCEETLFRGWLKYDQHGEFNRGLCVSKGAADSAGPLIDILVGEE